MSNRKVKDSLMRANTQLLGIETSTIYRAGVPKESILIHKVHFRFNVFDIKSCRAIFSHIVIVANTLTQENLASRRE